MKYTCSIAMGPIDQLVDLAKTAEEVGVDSIARPDSPFYMEKTIGKLDALRAEFGRDDEPFEFQAVCVDKFGVDGHRELAEAGVTDNIVIPWLSDGFGFDAPLEKKTNSLKRFADTYINTGWQQ